MTKQWIPVEERDSEDVVQLSETLMDETLALKKALIDERMRLGISQDEIAAFMGVSVEEVQEFEEHWSDPHLSDIRWYAGFLGVAFSINVYSSVRDDILRIAPYMGSLQAYTTKTKFAHVNSEGVSSNEQVQRVEYRWDDLSSSPTNLVSMKQAERA